MNPVSSVDIGDNANLELVDKFCFLEMLMQLWRPEFELDGINSGSSCPYLSIRIFH